jgi:hypothetical protein
VEFKNDAGGNELPKKLKLFTTTLVKGVGNGGGG